MLVILLPAHSLRTVAYAGGEGESGDIMAQLPMVLSVGADRVAPDFEAYRGRIDRLCAGLTGHPQCVVELQGNTDTRGSVEFMSALGQRYADSVKLYFVQHGCPASQLVALSYGKEKPVSAGRGAKNRRVEVVLKNQGNAPCE